MTGQTIAHYRLGEKIGAGGMGEVYRATDTRLGRAVALKILPQAFAADPERMARFAREAQLLASLNHPNIAAIYGLEEAPAERSAASGAPAPTIRALAMELVEGPTLGERIAGRALPVDEALPIARQIAEALEYAHERGIIHRDLKPANVKLTADGNVKILDFGLAKAMAGDPSVQDISHSPTLTIAATQAGVILGTAAYMPPEQAKGKTVDRRADIWSFGCVLYEMLTGKQAFTGETVSDTLAAVLKEEPDWTALPKTLPAVIRRLLARCLTKDARRRLRDIGEARIAIEEAQSGRPEEILGAVAVTRPRRAGWTAAVAGVALVILLTALITRELGTAPGEAPLRRFLLPVEDLAASRIAYPVISPDGNRVAYIAGGGIWVRELDRLEPRALAESDGARNLFWSPGSDWIGFGRQDGRLWKVAVNGGRPSTIGEIPGAFEIAAGAAWTAEDRIYFTTGTTGLYQISALGGDPVEVLPADTEKENDFHEATLLPGGRGVLFIVHRRGAGPDTIAVFSGGRRKDVFRMDAETLFFPCYSPSGHIIFQRETSNPGLWAVPFSLAKLETTGEPFLIVPGGGMPSVAGDGTLVYVQQQAALGQLAWVDRAGADLRRLGAPQLGLLDPELSRDGRRVAVSAADGGDREIWILDLARETRARVTSTRAIKSRPHWGPGDRILYFSTLNPDRVYALDLAGSGSPRALIGAVNPTLSLDGKWLVVQDRSTNRGALRLIELAKAEAAAAQAPPDAPPDISGLVPLLIGSPYNEEHSEISPDGRFLAYTAADSRGRQVYLRRFPSGEGQWQVSIDSGTRPRWRGDGRELYFVDAGREALMAVSVELGATVSLGAPRELFSAARAGMNLFDGYDVSPDGRRFLVILGVGEEGAGRGVVVVQNWFGEFRGRERGR